ncbi:MAG: fluoride efflux transporter CrcB [Thioalkalispiraceae bacterium]
MLNIIAIAGGGAIGALLRYWMSGWVYSLAGRDFPYGTLAVNVMGSFMMGLLFILLDERFNLGPQWRALLLIGLLGAFTTFSTFSIETLNLLLSGEAGKAVLNILLSVSICIFATWLGILIGRQV